MAAIGKTISAANSPCSAPETIFSMATSDTGSGASTRSSISRVTPNSVTMGRATAWMPWNSTARPITPATSRVENSAAPVAPPTPWPIFGNT